MLGCILSRNINATYITRIRFIPATTGITRSNRNCSNNDCTYTAYTRRVCRMPFVPLYLHRPEEPSFRVSREWKHPPAISCVVCTQWHAATRHLASFAVRRKLGACERGTSHVQRPPGKWSGLKYGSRTRGGGIHPRKERHHPPTEGERAVIEAP